jgi:pSer/pThr/pTyr-binding forkhead associated (FHA) protein
MKLVIEDEAGTRSTVPFTGDEITIGRAAEGVTFRIGDRNVSRRHARFVRASGSVWIEDLGSVTGTRVNGERLAGRRKLRPGDLVQIGDYDLALTGETELAAADAPPPLPTPRPRDVEPTPLASAKPTPRPSVAPPRRAPLRRVLLAGLLALALGAAAGWAVGTYLAPPQPAPTAGGTP